MGIKVEEDVIYIDEDDKAINEDLILEAVHNNPIINVTDPLYGGGYESKSKLWNQEFPENVINSADQRKLSYRKVSMEGVENFNKTIDWDYFLIINGLF